MTKTSFNLKVWGNIILLIALLFIFSIVFRYIMIQTYIDLSTLQNSVLWRFYKIGLLYDLRIITPAFAPLLLFGLITTIFKNGIKEIFFKITPYYAGIIAFLYSLAWFVNFYYFQTYHTQIDIFIFGVVDDDLGAILKIMWQNYPVLKILGLCLGFSFSCFALFKYINAKTHLLFNSFSFPSSLAIPLNLALLIVYICAIRGSVISTPLLRAQANVSHIQSLNHLVPNPIIAFTWAKSDYKITSNFHPVSLARGEELQDTTHLKLFHTTPNNAFLQANPPHVIINLMESFGLNFLDFDNPKTFDVLGELRKHFASDFVFKRFLPGANGTAASLSALFFGSPSAQIGLSDVKKISLEGNIFAAYKNAGYQIIFLTAGNASWYGYGDFMRVLGADEIYDQNYIIDHFPQASQFQTAYGIPDEFLYQTLQKILLQAKKPTFAVILTISNHPPEVIPTDYKSYPLIPNNKVKSYLDEKFFPLVPLAYQYANDSFGKFLTWIKSSPLKDKTIIAATGDHKLRSLKAFEIQKEFLNYGVPLYLYAPQAYLQAINATYNPNTLGSHKDIIPTVLELSLSNAKYFSLGGENMLKDSKKCRFAFNEAVYADCLGMYIGGGVYQWQKPNLIHSTPNPIPQDKLQWIKSYKELWQWQINYRTKGIKK